MVEIASRVIKRFVFSPIGSLPEKPLLHNGISGACGRWHARQWKGDMIHLICSVFVKAIEKQHKVIWQGIHFTFCGFAITNGL